MGRMMLIKKMKCALELEETCKLYCIYDTEVCAALRVKLGKGQPERKRYIQRKDNVTD